MYQFDSIQQALDYVFDGKKLSIINLPDNPFHWFFVDEIRTIVEYKRNNYEFTKSLEFRDQVTAVLDLSNYEKIGDTIGNGVSDFIANSHPEARRFMIISEPGLYELLIRSQMPKAKSFREWLFFVVLPTLRANPRLVEQINDQAKQIYKQAIQIENLQRELNDARQMGTYYFNSRKKIIQERNIYRNNPHYMLEYYKNLLETDPAFEREARGEDGFTLIGVPNPNFDEEKYNKVLARIKMCEDMLKGYLD